MKKEYISPSAKVYQVHTAHILAGSVTVDPNDTTKENLSKEQFFSADEEW